MLQSAETTKLSKYERLISAAQRETPAATIVAHPCDETSLRGAVEAADAKLILPVLVGPQARIRAVAAEHRIDIDGYEIVDAPHRAMQPLRDRSSLSAKGGANC